MKKRVIIEMDNYEFDELVSKTFGVSQYEFAAHEEAHRDSSYSFNKVTGQDRSSSEYDKNKMVTFLESDGRKGHYMAGTLLNKMVKLGILEPGDYLITV